ncbi:MAG: NAD(P)/FAD-dependent oxidoreductase [Kiritimatiellia bacterium]
MSKPNIVIAGAGFAGLAAVRGLRSAAASGKCTVTVIDRNADTTMVPALPDYAAGLIPKEWITRPVTSLLPDYVRFEQTNIRSMHFAEQTVETEKGPIPYDFLIVALGSVSAPPAPILATLQTHTVTSLGDTQVLQNAFEKLLQQDTSPQVLINGAGYTGLELAIAMKRRAWRDRKAIDMHVVEQRPQILPFLPQKQRQRVLACIHRHGIKLHLNSEISSITNQQVALTDGTRLDAPLLCRTEGTIAPVHPHNSGVELLGDLRMQVQPTLALQAYPNVFAAGDAAAFAIPDGYLRKAVNFAYYAGEHAGRNVARVIHNRQTRPFKPLDLGWVIPLGDDSVGQVFGGIPMSGKLGLRMHYIMCGYRNYSIKNFFRLAGHAVRTGKTYK